jgi:hypothetical protein
MKNRDDLHPFRWDHHRDGLTPAAEPPSPTVPEPKNFKKITQVKLKSLFKPF